MADSVVGPIMDKIINACSDYLQDQFRWQTGMKEELQRLRENHPKVQAVVSASNQAQIRDRNSELKSLIWQLRDIIDEADDVLDDFEYVKLEEQLVLNMEETEVRSSFNKLLLKLARILCRVCQRALKIDHNLRRLEKVVTELDKVSAEVSAFHRFIKNAKQEQQEQQDQLSRDRETGSLPENDLIGRGEEKDFVMQWLKPTNEDPTHIASTALYKNISLLSIVGHGGMGKTTLLKHIFEDQKEKFELKIWVYVSHHFDAKTIIADMLGFLKKERPRSESLATLQESLKAVVRSKRFLLVLDDIWEEDMKKWANVLSPLAFGSFGSKILITTRMFAVASAMAKVIKTNIETLKGLEEDVCLELLKTHAFAGVENLGAHKKLADIASLIVKKLSGCPLAAKVIGDVLNSDLNVSYWMKILESNVLNVESEPGRNDILPILRLSFTFLPQPLQNCFTFCGVFPQDHKFDKDDLVRMWIALGFIQDSSIEGETLEDIGGRYFDVLVRKSFFDEFQQYERIYYKMHDLLHDLAQSISSEECYRFVGDDVLSFKVPKNVRHLFVKTENPEVLRMIKDVKNLHSFFLISDHQCSTKIFEASRRIRLLFLCCPFQAEISEAIKNLRHLRYSNISAALTHMPRSLSSLYHLRYISLNGCLEWETLPPFGQLPHLKSLYLCNMPKAKRLDHKFQGNDKVFVFPSLEVLNMEGLQVLEDWFDGAVDCFFPCLTELFLDNCPNLQELPYLPPKLKKIKIQNIGWKGALNFKKGTSNCCGASKSIPLEKLEVLWCPNITSILLADVDKLRIEGCPDLISLGGPQQAESDIIEVVIDDPSLLPMLSIASLEKLTICNNYELVSFTIETEQWFSHIRSSLRELCFRLLVSLPSSLEGLFSLEILRLEYLKILHCLPFSLSAISSLKCLYLESIPALQSLPDLPLSLNRLIIKRLYSLECLPSSLSRCSSLRFLYLECIPELESLPDLPPSLIDLRVGSLYNLKWLPSSLSAISSLSLLELKSIPLLRSLPELPLSLSALELDDLDSLECLPSSLSVISSLKKLKLRRIPLLKSLPDLPSLCSITITNCDPELMKRYNKEK